MCLHCKRGGGGDVNVIGTLVRSLYHRWQRVRACGKEAWKEKEGERRSKEWTKKKIKIKEERGQLAVGMKNQGSKQGQKTTTDAARNKPAGHTYWKTRIMQEMDWCVDLNAQQIRQGVMEMIKHPGTCVEKHGWEEGFRTLTDISKPISLGKPQKKDREHKSSRPKQVWNVYSAVCGGRKLDK